MRGSAIFWVLTLPVKPDYLTLKLTHGINWYIWDGVEMIYFCTSNVLRNGFQQSTSKLGKNVWTNKSKCNNKDAIDR